MRKWLFRTIALTVMMSGVSWSIDSPANLQSEKMAMQQMRLSAFNFSETSSETAVDSTRYLVGPGDVFIINVKELPSNEFKATVRSNGSVLINEFGEIYVARHTLTDAYQVIRERILKSLRGKATIFITLRELKKLSVTVIGPLMNAGLIQMPGGLPLPGNARVFDAIKLANGGYFPGPDYLNIREIVIRNAGEIRTVDLLEYQKSKDPIQNPYLYPGDEILVSPTTRFVFVGGQVQSPISHEHKVPLKEGETLASFAKSLIFKSLADTSEFFIRREFGTVERVKVEQAGSFLLKSNDWLVVPSLESEWRTDTATISGEVRKSGVFPIQSGITTAAQLLEWAGGSTTDADPSRAFLIRSQSIMQKVSKIREPNFTRSSDFGEMGSALEGSSVRPEMSGGYAHMVASGDFAILHLGADFGAVTLEEGDEIVVPRKEKYVYISGRVSRPGAYLHDPRNKLNDYVRMAGGYTPQAAKGNIYLATQYSKRHFQFKHTDELKAGDIIVVPTSIELKKFRGIILPISQMVISILSLTLSIVALSK